MRVASVHIGSNLPPPNEKYREADGMHTDPTNEFMSAGGGGIVKRDIVNPIVYDQNIIRELKYFLSVSSRFLLMKLFKIHLAFPQKSLF